MKLLVTLNLDNATFADNGRDAEAASVLTNCLVDPLEDGRLALGHGVTVTLKDSNGNTVGTAVVDEGPGAKAAALQLALATILRLANTRVQRDSVRGTLDVINAALKD